MIDFREKYQEFLEQPFPEGMAGEEIDGFDLVLLDSSLAGILERFISKNGKLTVSDLKLLKELNAELQVVLGKLESVEKFYFERLSWLTSFAVKFSEANKT